MNADCIHQMLSSEEQDSCASQPQSQQREVFQSSRRTLVNERHRQHTFTRFEECRKRSQHSSPRTHLAHERFQGITSQDIHESDSKSRTSAHVVSQAGLTVLRCIQKPLFHHVNFSKQKSIFNAPKTDFHVCFFYC